MVKVLWFSRHQLSPEQLADLEVLYGPVQVTQIDRSINYAFELKEEIQAADVVAIVAPIGLQGQFLQLAGERPVLLCRNHRIPSGEVGPNGEPLYTFVHAGWDRLQEVKVVKTTLTDHAPPEGTFRK